MTRTQKIALSWLVGIAALVGCQRSGPDAVILIVVDTLRADHLGVYGYDRDTSPRLDEWAQRGVVIDQALSTSPWTLPTFGSILTGMNPSQHGAGERARDSGKRWKRAPLLDTVTTLPEVLAVEGWQTAAVVSNPFLREHFGLSRGFDIYDYERGRTADAVVDRSLELVEDLADRPFFLMIHLIDPHLPYRAPEAFRGKFSGDREQTPIGKSRKEIISVIDDLTAEDRQNIIDRYDEEIAFTDQQLGRLLDQLAQRDLLTRSLVVLTSDHGEELFDHGEFEHGHSMHQELLRVPLLLWESSLEPHRVSAPISLADLPQTIFDATQGEPSSALAGVSRWDWIQGGGGTRSDPIVAENTLWTAEKKVMVRWPYKLVLHEKSGRRELYNLETDPGEQNDLAANESELAERMALALDEVLDFSDVDLNRESIVITDETEDELRSLGYLD